MSTEATPAGLAVSIRPVTLADAPAVAGLLDELGYPTTVDRLADQLRKGASHGSEVLVAQTADRGVVGFASLQVIYGFAEDNRACQLSAIAVAPRARRRGVGRRLVEAVEARAARLGCSSVRITSGRRPERVDAHRLYVGLGYEATPSGGHMDFLKPLERRTLPADDQPDVPHEVGPGAASPPWAGAASPSEVGRTAQYEPIADDFLEHAADGFYNAHYDRPACLELLGAVAAKRILDAACGPGLYAQELVLRGATVVGFDQSPRMVALASQRVPQGDFRVWDLADPLEWLPDASVDAIIVALALEYVDDRVAALSELRRVLRPDGALVLSRQHPTADWLAKGGSYFQTKVIEEVWSKGWRIRYWLAPLERTCEEVHEAGFLIERIVEPRPTEPAQERDPFDYERLQRTPGFLAMRLLPRR